MLVDCTAIKYRQIHLSGVARAHTMMMDGLHKKGAEYAMAGMCWMDEYESTDLQNIPEVRRGSTVFTVYPLSTTMTVQLLSEKEEYNQSIGALVFGSSKRPGGGFLNGSLAQEEMVCHTSNLYNIIRSQKHLYGRFTHQERSNPALRGFHSDAMLYVPNVTVHVAFNAPVISCNMLISSAPNVTFMKKHNTWKDHKAEYKKVIHNRIDRILYNFARTGNTTIVLGAYGCGVYGNGPKLIAKEFMELLTNKYEGVFTHVGFAIPLRRWDGTSTSTRRDNYQAFVDVINSINIDTNTNKIASFNERELVEFAKRL